MSKTAFVPTASFRASKGQLDRLRRALEAGAEVVIEQPGGERLTSRELSEFLAAAVSGVASGDEVVLLRGESEVSPAEAGELLGISRQFVDRLIDVGKPRRVGCRAAVIAGFVSPMSSPSQRGVTSAKG